jgi:hypothetical protein
MLIPSKTLLTASLAASLLIACSTVRKGPGIANVQDGPPQAQTLVVTNATAAPVTLVPPKDRPGVPETVLQPAETKQLEFSVSQEHNIGSPGIKEFVLVPEKSSPYFAQRDVDLILRTRFGSGSPKEIRVALGECLFDKPAPPGGHVLSLQRPPLPGVPALDLCP